MAATIRLYRCVPAVALALLLLQLIACGRLPAGAPTPTLAPTAVAPPEPTPGPAADAWAAVRERGRLVVGTSADYPPFAYYTDDFQLDGYDVALARLIGERLGVAVEFNDMAFDGLGGALQVGQIDAAIAAISVSEARQGLVDFSSVYYISQDAALARADSPILVNKVEDLAPWRVAVQAGSVFQTWLQGAAVDTGILPAANLLVYTSAEQAIADLRAGRADVFIADRLPLEAAAADGELALVGRDLNEERFAVALAKGSTLLNPVNEALAALEAEGALDDLAARYLDLAAAELTALPAPEPTPVAPQPTARAVLPASGCIDAMTLVEDITFDDDNMRAPQPVAPAEAFQKVWRVQNVGTCVWNNGYLLVPAGGNTPAGRMSGQATPLPERVAPGASVDIAVDLVAPLAPGVHQGFWSLRAPNGLLFGDRLGVGVAVVEAATPTPEPTAAPSPGVSFAVDRDSIRAGECATFTWAVTNAAQVYFSAQGEPWQLNGAAASGSQAVCPNATTTYDLRVVATDGTTDIRSIRVDVQPAPNAPAIVFFTLTPSFQIAAGQCVDVRWRVSGDVGNVLVTRNDRVLWDGAPLNGTSRDCPPVGEAVYAIEASGPGGPARGQQNVSVLPPPTSPPQATATPVPPTPPPGVQPPVINAFAVNPGQINPGQCVTVSWSVGGNAAQVQILRNGIVVLDFALFTGSVNDCLTAAGTYTYRVQAADTDGRTAFQQASVTVGSPPASLVGGWRLVDLNGATIIPGTEITAVFGDSGNLSGSSGCNSYTTGYLTNGTGLSVGQLGGAPQFCAAPPGLMEQEQLYRLVLSSASGYTVDGQQLTVRSGRGQLTFEALASP